MQEKIVQSRNPAGFHRVAYKHWGTPSNVPPVICVHGLTRASSDFDALAKRLEESREIFCPDVVGRGKSDWFANPDSYNTVQYLSDLTALIARTGAPLIDWVGTSMGGIIGMMLAAEEGSPIRRIVVNDVGPFISLLSLKRIGAYLGAKVECATFEEAEKYTRETYADFGDLSDEQWRHLTGSGMKRLASGHWVPGYDPAIAKGFLSTDEDVNFWQIYERITCPVLVLRGLKSDILSAQVAQQMTERGPKAQLVEFPKVGHAPALMDPTQISIIAEFLRP